MAASLVQEDGFICVVGLAQPRSNVKAHMAKKYFMHNPYLFLVHNFLSQVGFSNKFMMFLMHNPYLFFVHNFLSQVGY